MKPLAVFLCLKCWTEDIWLKKVPGVMWIEEYCPHCRQINTRVQRA